MTTDTLPPGATFPLGRIVISQATKAWLPAETLARALKRHQAGDWGDPIGETALESREALEGGGPVTSRYRRPEPGFTIVTSGDRSTTTVYSFWDLRA